MRVRFFDGHLSCVYLGSTENFFLKYNLYVRNRKRIFEITNVYEIVVRVRKTHTFSLYIPFNKFLSLLNIYLFYCIM